MDELKLKGKYILEIWRNGHCISKEVIENLITYEGRDHLIDCAFNSDTQNANWYISFIDNAAYSAVSLADTHDSHSGWAEVVPYSNATRVAWAPDASSNGVITNSTSADFNINATATIKGIFISNISTKSSTAAAVLFNAAVLGSTKAVLSGDTVKITYQLTTT